MPTEPATFQEKTSILNEKCVEIEETLRNARRAMRDARDWGADAVLQATAEQVGRKVSAADGFVAEAREKAANLPTDINAWEPDAKDLQALRGAPEPIEITTP